MFLRAFLCQSDCNKECLPSAGRASQINEDQTSLWPRTGRAEGRELPHVPEAAASIPCVGTHFCKSAQLVTQEVFCAGFIPQQPVAYEQKEVGGHCLDFSKLWHFSAEGEVLMIICLSVVEHK